MVTRQDAEDIIHFLREPNGPYTQDDLDRFADGAGETDPADWVRAIAAAIGAEVVLDAAERVHVDTLARVAAELEAGG